MKTAIKLILVYLLMQILAALIAGPLSMAYVYATEGTLENELTNKGTLALAMLLGFVFMGVYLWRKGYLTNDRHMYSPVSFFYLFWTMVAGVSYIFLIDFLMSHLSFLPDWLSDTFDLLQANWLGIVCIAVLGPILEELLFRGAVTKVLLEKYSPAKAILISGLIFGIFHLNPAQMVAGCLSGFLLAWIYYKTRSLIPCILIHILNNGLSVYLGINYEDVDTTSQLLGEPLYMICLIVSVLLFLLSLKMLNNYKLSNTNTTVTTGL